tara:strand:+ start:2349 stop:3401 length:1053 start_codon:yes stop_codon:yes gene_type:complete
MPLPDHRDVAHPKLLFVKLKHIGDALILTPTLRAVRDIYPQAEIWVVVRKGSEGILAGCSAIDHLLTVASRESERRTVGDFLKDLKLGLHLRRQRFDFAFDLTDGDRGRWMVGLARAARRCVSTTKGSFSRWWGLWMDHQSAPWSGGHRVEKDFHLTSELISLGGEVPRLCFEADRSTVPSAMRGVKDFVVLHPGSRWKKKRWPLSHWLELGRLLLERTQTLVVSCGPAEDERELAREMVSGLEAGRVVSSDGQWSWAELAGCLWRARAYVGLDTAATHLAAACQCPIVAMYAYTVVEQWKPWRTECRLFHPLQWMESWEEVLETPPSEIMRAHDPCRVMEAVEEVIRPA